MSQFLVGGVSAKTVVAGGILSLFALAGAGIAGRHSRPNHPTEIVISPDTGDPGLTAEPGDTIDWASTQHVTVTFVGSTGKGPCSGSTNPCVLQPLHDGDSYLYSCSIDAPTGGTAVACSDPLLGPISSSATLESLLEKQAAQHIQVVPLAAGASTIRTQVECDAGDNAPDLYSPNAEKPVQPVSASNPVDAKFNDQITWTNAAGANLVVSGLSSGFACVEQADATSGYAQSGCTIKSGTGLVSYAVIGCTGKGTTLGYVKLP